MRFAYTLCASALCLLLTSPAAAVLLLTDAREIEAIDFLPECTLGPPVTVSDSPSAPFAPFDSEVEAGCNTASPVSEARSDWIDGQGRVWGVENQLASSTFSIEFEVLQPVYTFFEATVSYRTGTGDGVRCARAWLTGVGAVSACGDDAQDYVFIETVLDPGVYNVTGFTESGFE